MAKSPAFRFYPSDFMGSPDVQAMDLIEVGAYTLLLCIAWQQDRHGCLPDNEDRIRRWAKMTPAQWEISRDILLGKFPIIESGVRGNGRMISEARKQAEFSAKQSAKGSLGGRPKKPQVSEIKPQLTNQKPEESQMKAAEKPSVSVSVSVEKTSPPSIRPEEFANLWNEERGHLPKVSEFTTSRRDKVKSRITQGLTLEKYRQVVVACRTKPFLAGESGWTATFDWTVANDKNYLKAIENDYGLATAKSPKQTKFLNVDEAY